jgi:hypothetical protein
MKYFTSRMRDGLVGALEHAAEAHEVPRLVVRHRGVGDALEEVAAHADLAEGVEHPLGLGQRPLGLDLQVHAVDLRPHLRRDRLPHRARVLARVAQARRDRIRVVGVIRQPLDHARLGRQAEALLERLGVAARVDERLPLLRRRQRQIDLQVEVDADEARHVLGALDVARHPVDGIGDAAEERERLALIRAPRCPCCRRPATS